jgi:hypothetical protein
LTMVAVGVGKGKEFLFSEWYEHTLRFVA